MPMLKALLIVVAIFVVLFLVRVIRGSDPRM